MRLPRSLTTLAINPVNHMLIGTITLSLSSVPPRLILFNLDHHPLLVSPPMLYATFFISRAAGVAKCEEEAYNHTHAAKIQAEGLEMKIRTRELPSFSLSSEIARVLLFFPPLFSSIPTPSLALSSGFSDDSDVALLNFRALASAIFEGAEASSRARVGK